MFKEKEILEELKMANRNLNRIIAVNNAKKLKEMREKDETESIWIVLIILFLLGDIEDV